MRRHIALFAVALSLRLLVACGDGCVTTTDTTTEVAETCGAHEYRVACNATCSDCTCSEDGVVTRHVGSLFCAAPLDSCGFPS